VLFVGDPKHCDAAGGWYYDEPAPTETARITLCQATCDLDKASVDIILGCDTARLDGQCFLPGPPP
jgi:hypothetical protein